MNIVKIVTKVSTPHGGWSDSSVRREVVAVFDDDSKLKEFMELCKDKQYKNAERYAEWDHSYGPSWNLEFEIAEFSVNEFPDLNK